MNTHLIIKLGAYDWLDTLNKNRNQIKYLKKNQHEEWKRWLQNELKSVHVLLLHYNVCCLWQFNDEHLFRRIFIPFWFYC